MKYALALFLAVLPAQAHSQDLLAFFESCPNPSAKIDGPTQSDWDNYAAGRIGIPLPQDATQRERDFYEAGQRGIKLAFIKPRCPTATEAMTYGSLAAAECFLGPDRIGAETKAALAHARKNLLMAPHFQGLCIKVGIVPFSLRSEGGKRH